MKCRGKHTFFPSLFQIIHDMKKEPDRNLTGVQDQLADVASLPQPRKPAFHSNDTTDDDEQSKQVDEPAGDIVPDHHPEILVYEECLVADPIRPAVLDKESSEVIHLLVVHIPQRLRNRPIRGIRQVPPFDDCLGTVDDGIDMVVLVVHADVRGLLPGKPCAVHLWGQSKVSHPLHTGGKLKDHQLRAVRIIRIQDMGMHLVVPLVIRSDRLIPGDYHCRHNQYQQPKDYPPDSFFHSFSPLFL